MKGTLTAVLSALLATPALAQAVPQLRDAEARALVDDRDPEGNLAFNYVISSGPQSDGPVFIFSVDLSRPAGTAELSADGLTMELSDISSPTFASFVADMGIDAATVVPSGCSAPSGWGCSLAVDRSLFWAFRDPAQGIAPGATGTGFVLLSRGLPRIVDAVLEPRFVFYTEGDEVNEADRVRADQEFEAIKYPVRTLGPTPPPEPLNLPAMVSSLRTQATEARSLGWIQTDEALNSLQAMLQDLEAALHQGQISEAKALTKAVVSFVDSQSCKSLSCPGSLPLQAETFALIRFNIDFLRAQLPNVAPDCSGAVPSPDLFWPPNHEVVDVSIAGVIDADGDALTYQFSSVTQDEGVLEPGSGNFCPDAVISGDSLQLRSERAGRLNGRVYRITFTAEDTVGATCSRTVPVCMPHEESDTPTCIEEPEQHESTVCP
jgi:hypothetical protein